MATFQVESYMVQMSYDRSMYRVLTLSGSRGWTAVIYFKPDQEALYARVDASNASRPRVVCWLPLSEFTYFYDILRSEKPINFTVKWSGDYGDEVGSAIVLGTTTEPIGEGPKDSSAPFSWWPFT